MSIGKQIKVYLIKNNISQAWLSEETKISPSKLSASLNDKRKLNVNEYARIINALKVEANEFIKI